MVLHDSDGKNHRHKTHLLVATHPNHQTHSTEKQVSLHKFIMYNHVHISGKTLCKKARQYYSLLLNALLVTQINICTCTLVIKGSVAVVEFPSKGCWYCADPDEWFTLKPNKNKASIKLACHYKIYWPQLKTNLCLALVSPATGAGPGFSKVKQIGSCI